MRKEYRDTIISGIGGILAVGITKYLTHGKYPFDLGAYIITYSIFFTLAHFVVLFRKRREAKEKDQLEELEE